MPTIQAVGSPGASPGASASYDRVGSFSTAADDPDSSGGITSFLGFNTSGRLSPVRALLRDPRITGFYQEHCTYLPAMSGWFLFSSLLSTYNKYVFGEKHLDFPCPLLLTSMHFWTQWGFSWSMCKLFPTLFGSKTVDDMTWREFLEISIPCGLVTSGDIGLSNLSMVTISLTFYTMVKASSPIFVLFWAYFFGIMEIKWSLCLVVLVICVGEFLTVMGEVDFVVKGFAMCLMATCLSGARWTLVQLKIQGLDPPLKTTVATMRVLSPFMALSMTFVALALEQPWYSLRSVIDSWATLFNVLMLGFMGASLAICMIMCEFFLIMHSNAIVLMIGGVIKEILTIFIGVNFFGDRINGSNFVGCCIVFMGVVLYKVTLHHEKEQAAKQAHALEDDINEHVQEKRGILKDRSDTENNGYKDDDPNAWNGQAEGIEMPRKTSGPLMSRGNSGGKDMDMLVV